MSLEESRKEKILYFTFFCNSGFEPRKHFSGWVFVVLSSLAWSKLGGFYAKAFLFTALYLTDTLIEYYGDIACNLLYIYIYMKMKDWKDSKRYNICVHFLALHTYHTHTHTHTRARTRTHTRSTSRHWLSASTFCCHCRTWHLMIFRQSDVTFISLHQSRQILNPLCKDKPVQHKHIHTRTQPHASHLAHMYIHTKSHTFRELFPWSFASQIIIKKY